MTSLKVTILAKFIFG